MGGLLERARVSPTKDCRPIAARAAHGENHGERVFSREKVGKKGARTAARGRDGGRRSSRRKGRRGKVGFEEVHAGKSPKAWVRKGRAVWQKY